MWNRRNNTLCSIYAFSHIFPNDLKPISPQRNVHFSNYNKAYYLMKDIFLNAMIAEEIIVCLLGVSERRSCFKTSRVELHATRGGCMASNGGVIALQWNKPRNKAREYIECVTLLRPRRLHTRRPRGSSVIRRERQKGTDEEGGRCAAFAEPYQYYQRTSRGAVGNVREREKAEREQRDDRGDRGE